MPLNLPAYKNQGPFCAEYSLKGILEFLRLSLPFEKIVSGIGRKDDKLIYPVEIIPFLHKNKIPFQYPFIRDEVEETLKLGIEEKMKEFYGYNRGDKIFKSSNPENILKSMQYVLDHELGTNQHPSLDDLEMSLRENKVPLLVINIDLLQKKDNRLRGHYIYLSGFGKSHFYYHDTGPVTLGKNHKIRKDSLPPLLRLTWHDYSTITIG